MSPTFGISILYGFLGGILIGGAAAIMLLGAGEIMGFSGIISAILQNPYRAMNDPSQQWKFTFLSTFLLSAIVVFLPWADQDRIEAIASITSPWAYLISGFLVGFGTKIGNGCTSGHGICGMARLSKRSIVAVMTFMGFAVATTIVTSPEQATGQYFTFLRKNANVTYYPWIFPVVAAIVVLMTLYGYWLERKRSQDKEQEQAVSIDYVNQGPEQAQPSSSSLDPEIQANAEKEQQQGTQDDANHQEGRKRVPAAIAGIVASGGLSLSTMVYPEAVRNFLDLPAIGRGTWDPTLMFVMMGALFVSFASYQFVPNHSIISSCPKMECPYIGNKFGVPTNTSIDAKLIGGAMCFGIGWGITGACPGPALLLTMTGLSGMVIQWWPAFFVGSWLGEGLKMLTA
jgi:hypothetical protein